MISTESRDVSCHFAEQKKKKCYSADNHRVCDDCLREMAKAAADDGAIANRGVGLKCVEPNCPGVILYGQIVRII